MRTIVFCFLVLFRSHRRASFLVFCFFVLFFIATRPMRRRNGTFPKVVKKKAKKMEKEEEQETKVEEEEEEEPN